MIRFRPSGTTITVIRVKLCVIVVLNGALPICRFFSDLDLQGHNGIKQLKLKVKVT